MSPPTRLSPWPPEGRPAGRWKTLGLAATLAVLLHALVLGAVPRGLGAGSEGGVKPLQLRQIVLAGAPARGVEAVAAAPAAERPPAAPPAPGATPKAAKVASPRVAGPAAPPAEPAALPEMPAVPDSDVVAALPIAAAASAADAADAADAALDAASDAAAPAAPAAALESEVIVAAAASAARASAGAVAASEAATPALAGGAPLPVYATRPAPAATLRYELRRGGLRGSGELNWRPRADGYALTLRGTAFSLPLIEWTSEGGFDAAGLAPTRFVDRRRARDARAANFQRDVGRISFSGPATVYPLVPGAQDRVSWMLQLPAIVDAAPAVFGPGERIGLFVVGARGDADVWTFTVEGVESLELPAGRVEGALRLRREPRKPHDTRVEVWLDPARHHLPVRVRLSSLEAGEGNEFLLESMTLPP